MNIAALPDTGYRGSSGDLIADKRFAYAEALSTDGDFLAAAEVFEQTIELVPDWAPAQLAFGLALEKAGHREAALAAMLRANRLDPDGALGTPLHVARLRNASVLYMPPAYVAALFDQYADRFDAHLLGTLGYRGPEVILDAITRTVGERHFDRALDLGCGTGLMARAARGRADEIDGIDLSPGMIEQARATSLYRGLAVSDCTAWLEQCADESYDLILAADVFVYLGDLTAVLCQSARVLARKGVLAFTLQTADEGREGLGPDLRFRHAPSTVRRGLSQAGLAVRIIEAQSMRREGGFDVPGLVVVAQTS